MSIKEAIEYQESLLKTDKHMADEHQTAIAALKVIEFYMQFHDGSVMKREIGDKFKSFGGKL